MEVSLPYFLTLAGFAVALAGITALSIDSWTHRVSIKRLRANAKRTAYRAIVLAGAALEANAGSLRTAEEGCRLALNALIDSFVAPPLDEVAPYSDVAEDLLMALSRPDYLDAGEVLRLAGRLLEVATT